MAIVAVAANYAGATGTTLAYPIANTAGNFLVCVFRGHPTDVVSDTNGNTGWTQATGSINGPQGAAIWFCQNCKAGANTVTAASAQALAIAEYSGVASNGALGSVASQLNPASATYTTPPITTTQAVSLIIGVVENETANSLTDTPSGGFTDRANGGGNVFLADQIVAAPGTFTYGGLLSSVVDSATAVAAFGTVVSYTIAGNAGVAGATVALTGLSTASTTSAADGTYSFSGLTTLGAYVVTPTLAGVTFTPTHLNETITIADILTANFAAQATTFVSTPIVTDDFQRPDAATLGANWTATTDVNASLEIATHLAVPPVGLVGSNLYTGATFANDQFAAATIDLFGIGSFLEVLVRNDLTDLSGYGADVGDDGLGNYILTLFDVVAAVQLGPTITLAGAPQPGDVVKIQAVGTLVTVFYNGVPVVSGTSAATASGSPSLFVIAPAAPTDTSLSLFTAGPALFSISGSVGAAGAGATIRLSGAASASTTAAGGTGDYSFIGLAPGTYYVTPGLTGKAFSPATTTVAIVGANGVNINFTLFTPSQSGSNSGAISTAGPRFATCIVSPRTNIIGTNLGTETRK